MTDHQPDPAARKHTNRPFAIAMIVLVLLFLAGLASMAVWMAREMGEFNPQAIFSRIAGKEVAMQLTDVPKAEDKQVVSQATTQVAQTNQVEETVVSGISEDKPTAKPTTGVIQATRTPIPTPMPTSEVAVVTTVAVATTMAVATADVPLATDTGSGGATTNETSEATTEASTETTTGQSTGSSSDPTSETVSGTPTGSISAPATSELPDTGFMDELGLPMLAMLGVILFLTILLVKYLRTSL
jgi:cobalamin biosynthesis Mg chelatase CobN